MSDNHVIPAEAVEAAVARLPMEVLRYIDTDDMRRALEVATLPLLAAAWEDGRLVGRAEEQSGFDTEMNPYTDPFKP